MYKKVKCRISKHGSISGITEDINAYLISESNSDCLLFIPQNVSEKYNCDCLLIASKSNISGLYYGTDGRFMNCSPDDKFIKLLKEEIKKTCPYCGRCG